MMALIFFSSYISRQNQVIIELISVIVSFLTQSFGEEPIKKVAEALHIDDPTITTNKESGLMVIGIGLH